MTREDYTTKMIDMVNRIERGCIVSKIKNFRAEYYEVSSITSGFDNPDTHYQTKTICIKYIGRGASALPENTKNIYFYSDFAPYAKFAVV